METVSTVSIPEIMQEPKTTQELEAAFAHLVTQITEIREQMHADDVSIRQSNAEYAILKAESQILRKQTEAILAGVRSLL